MSNTYTIINPSTWARRIHCQIFRNAAQPQYCITVELDVTHFQKTVKQNGWSFTLAFIFAVTKCANELDEYRYRFLGDEIVLYDSIDTCFSYLAPGDEVFKVINAPMQETMEDFIENTTRIISAQKEYFTGPIENDAYVFSALPWLHYTHVSHTDAGQKDRTNPMFDWGKYQEKDGTLKMPFSIQVHHSFVDGIHVGRLVDRLQHYLNTL